MHRKWYLSQQCTFPRVTVTVLLLPFCKRSTSPEITNFSLLRFQPLPATSYLHHISKVLGTHSAIHYMQKWRNTHIRRAREGGHLAEKTLNSGDRRPRPDNDERERGTSELAEKDSRPSRQTVEPKMALVWFETEAAGDRSLSKTSFRPEVDLPPPSSSECRTRGTVSQAVAVLQRGR